MLFDGNEPFYPFEFSSTEIKIDFWISAAGLNNLGRL